MVATSAGGPIGLGLTLNHPQRVSALALLNTGASLMSMTPTGVDAADPFVADRLSTVARRMDMLALFESSGAHAAVRVSELEWRTAPEPPFPDPQLELFRRARRRALQRLPFDELAWLAAGAMRNMRAQLDIDLTEELSVLQCRTLIAHGDADTTVPIAFGAALVQAIPHASFSVQAGQGHGLIADQRVQRLLRQWILAGGLD